MSIRVAAQRYPGPAAADAARRRRPGPAFCPEPAGPGWPGQLAQMFWLAVRDEKLGEGVGTDDWVVPAVWVVVVVP